MALPKPQPKNQELTENDWALTPEQMLFLMQNHNAIETAYEANNLEYLRQFAATQEFRELFGNMIFDKAYDRYETILETQ